ncbi:hypothetical protein M413DRAFT_446597 [Hebeloma cylindrosporum]|uniref:Uncharacterized protein n=1 Tax=Hebeloma cylindrosporum TaxID=76867 RepID=A0A0C2YH39_HEBCY|nr:hypothetical protein M413DRAFT_446597 [Hebeloma cylindrosporum h7]
MLIPTPYRLAIQLQFPSENSAWVMHASKLGTRLERGGSSNDGKAKREHGCLSQWLTCPSPMGPPMNIIVACGHLTGQLIPDPGGA